MRHGTHFFVTRAAVEAYFYYLSDKEISLKLKNSEVIVGLPTIQAGEKLILNRSEGRYFIEVGV